MNVADSKWAGTLVPAAHSYADMVVEHMKAFRDVSNRGPHAVYVPQHVFDGLKAECPSRLIEYADQPNRLRFNGAYIYVHGGDLQTSICL